MGAARAGGAVAPVGVPDVDDRDGWAIGCGISPLERVEGIVTPGIASVGPTRAALVAGVGMRFVAGGDAGWAAAGALTLGGSGSEAGPSRGGGS